MKSIKKEENTADDKVNFYSSNPQASNPVYKPVSAQNHTDKGLIAKINILGRGSSYGKTFSNFISHHSEKLHGVIDYAGFIKETNEIIQRHKNVKDTFNAFHNMFTGKSGASASALGIVNNSAIDIRLFDKSTNVYSRKLFMTEEDNEIIKAVITGETAYYEYLPLFNLPSYASAPCLVIPASIGGNVICVLAVSGANIQNYTNLYRLAALNLALLVQNEDLTYNTNRNSYIDSLTNLCSYRRFHELLDQAISDAAKNKTKVSVILFDINGMGEINREFGHAAGDDVIRTAAGKINECIKKQDIAARYGGDKFAVILKNTGSDEAAYTAEYILYSLSCCQVDKVGSINKISAGIASYPDDSADKEKLLMLSEQAVMVSKAKGCKNGRSVIICANDRSFWDDNSLNAFAEVLAKKHSQLGINVEDLLVSELQHQSSLSKNHLIEMVTSLASAIDAKDKYTKDHSASVSRYSAALAKAVNLPDEVIERIKLGALLHDIGKIGIPEDVLNKPAKLTEEEFNIIKQHPVIAVQKILEPNPALHDLIPIVKYHHEQWNGSGYPDGLKGEEIPLEARIAAIADTFHALISSRPYRRGMSIEKACRILEEGSGLQWDAELVRQFIAIAPALAAEI